MPKFYTSKQVIEDTMLIEISDLWIDEFERFLEQIENYIDSYTGRNFKADSAFNTKLFDGDGEKDYIFPDFISLESVAITSSSGEEAIYTPADGYFLLYPANQIPKNRIAFKDENALAFTKGQQNISASAKWGYSEIPPKEIELAASILMAGIINYAHDHESEVKSESIGDFSVSYHKEEDWMRLKLAMEILEKHRRVNF